MLLVLLLLSLAPAAAPTHDLLFMGPSDTREPWGLQYPLATPVQPLPSVPPTPPTMDLLAALEPSPLPAHAAEGFELFHLNGTALLFSTTRDFRTFSEPRRVFTLPTVDGWKVTPKTVGRSGDGRRYVFLAFCANAAAGKCGKPPSIPGEGVHAFVSTDVRSPHTTTPHTPRLGTAPRRCSCFDGRVACVHTHMHPPRCSCFTGDDNVLVGAA